MQSLGLTKLILKKRKYAMKTGKKVGQTNYLLGVTRIEQAYWCEKCNKVMGIFDVVANE